MKNYINNLKNLPVYVIVIIFSLFALIPFYIMFIMGTYANEELFTGLKILPSTYLLENLKTVLERNYFIFYRNSFVISASVTVGGTFISALTGFTFAKYNFRFKKYLFMFVLGTLMIPSQLGIVGYVIELKWLGMRNTLWPLIIPHLANAFAVFWMTQYIESAIPEEIIESGRIDGCSDFKIFLRIILPTIKPALITISLLLFLWSWNSYLQPLIILNKESLYTIPLGISILGNIYRTDYAARILALALATIPVLAFFSLGSKHLIKGLMAGSVKG